MNGHIEFYDLRYDSNLRAAGNASGLVKVATLPLAVSCGVFQIASTQLPFGLTSDLGDSNGRWRITPASSL